MTGKCALCLQDNAELQKSHLVPKGVIKRSSGDVTISPYTPHHSSSHQFAKHLLCSSCEQLLNKQGENTFLRLCQKTNGSFPLLDRLSKSVEIKELNPSSMMDQGALSDEERRAIIHFVLGIFWKGAQGQWMRQGKPIPMTNFSEKYREAMRLYLLGVTDKLPSRFYLTVQVATDSPELEFTPPASRNFGSFNTHAIYAHGVYFLGATGKNVPESISALSILSPPVHPILTGELKDFLTFSATRSMLMQPPSESLKNKLNL